jgi:2-polyprenyl-6-methoxyphenol hydroxylase-like FAD-dependent oxidoreductase/putative NADH-flavin reductase
MRIGKVAVIGAGPGGAAAGVWLAEHGVEVTLVEINHNAAVNGQAVTFGPQMLPGIAELGLLEEMISRGNSFRAVATDMVPGGPLKHAEVASPLPGVNPMLTMRRQELHDLLVNRARKAGATYLLGVGFASLRQLEDGVEVTLTDGSVGAYDLLIGADGLRSRVREFIAPGTEVESLPQGAYRAVVENIEYEHPDLSYMGSREDYLCGYIGLYGGLTYVTLAYNREEGRVEHADVPRRMREILAEEVGEMGRLRDLITDDLADIAGRVSYRRMETVMVEGPWHAGRAVLVGDAAHGTTPNLGLGAGMAMEDVLVLMRKLSEDSDATLADQLASYSAERLDRTLVVNRNSARLCRLQCELGTNSRVLLEEYGKAAQAFDATMSPTQTRSYTDTFSVHRENTPKHDARTDMENTRNDMAQITVIGGTGYAGRNIVAEAAKRGHAVTSYSRQAPESPVPGVEYRTGDVQDPSFLESAVTETGIVVTALSPRGELQGAGTLRQIQRRIAAAAQAAGARLGVVGGAGSLRLAEGGPTVLEAILPDHVKPEAQEMSDVLGDLRSSDAALDWFYLSPAAGFGSFNPGKPMGAYRTGGDVLVVDGDGNSFISGADYAVAFVDEIERAAHRRQRFTVGY